eukprot:TRINITY_DN20703_c0_g1_i1.p1 TRINITY_DN20703_c0_g1~~TRINITY_DN20703_c0_g1_i1.p1  ORF type:complete len:609 (+),score=80.01 TRINITY_DN20703_c0_g1_i1:86-1912(+)
MIYYERGGWRPIINICQWKGSVFPKSFLIAIPCAGLAGMFKYSEFVTDNGVLLNSTAWSGFSFLVGFLVVFRTSQAYSRFWDGATATHRMRAEWCDAASAIVAFTKHSKSDEQSIQQFKHLLIRLFSLFHAMALGELEGEIGYGGWPRAFDFDLIDVGGVDAESLRVLCGCEHKVDLVFQWIQSFIIENISTGILSIPPPILSRAFQELGNGMVAHHEALLISQIPFPFPYAQACDCLLVIHWLLTPFITAQWTPGVYLAAMFAFVQVFMLWTLTNIAVEIEHPFGLDSNDLDAPAMQEAMNQQLMLLVQKGSDRVPHLGSHVILDTGDDARMMMSRTFNDVLRSSMVEREGMQLDQLLGSSAEVQQNANRSESACAAAEAGSVANSAGAPPTAAAVTTSAATVPTTSGVASVPQAPGTLTLAWSTTTTVSQSQDVSPATMPWRVECREACSTTAYSEVATPSIVPVEQKAAVCDRSFGIPSSGKTDEQPVCLSEVRDEHTNHDFDQVRFPNAGIIEAESYGNDSEGSPNTCTFCLSGDANQGSVRASDSEGTLHGSSNSASPSRAGKTPLTSLLTGSVTGGRATNLSKSSSRHMSPACEPSNDRVSL